MAPFTVNGSRPVAALNMLVDSAEFNDILLGYVMGRGTTEQPVSLEAVESFEAQVSSFKAESGRASGAVVNLVTRSGTNEWRGSLYHLFQHSTLNARNALLSERPPGRSNIPGFTLGGPLRKNRLFFFGSFELPVRNTYSNSSRIQTLTEEQRRVAVASVRPLVELYPLPNVPGTNLNEVVLPNPQTMKSIIGKIDYAISSAHRLGYRQTFTKATGYKFTRIPAASRDSFNGRSWRRSRWIPPWVLGYFIKGRSPSAVSGTISGWRTQRWATRPCMAWSAYCVSPGSSRSRVFAPTKRTRRTTTTLRPTSASSPAAMC